MGVRALVADERSELAAFLRTLERAEWDAPSLCEGWRVRDVVAHLLYDTMSVPRYAIETMRAGFSTRRMNDRAVQRVADVDPDHLVDSLAASAQGGLVATVAPRIALADVVVHHQDIRRPLNRPRSIPAARLLAVLDHPDPFASPRSRTRGLRFIATDIEWTRGHGPEIHGPAEAIMMAISGRPVALEELTGRGVDQLRRRITANR
jgi:uncharacterized protein (TIGR03083 family)